MLLDIFSAPIASGAQTFWLIVAILVGLGAGITAVDFRSSVFKKDSKKD
ncbi:hypothetical protein [Cyclobacterium qasimii]|uniref:Uncharacterized protein n=1 Tax=Cyclobacterium qasimii M12-11B TaxID=641524 RepID=S7VHB0_9BACT|nr:hypothetical protein [Cyclobacterium qasimii]EPR69366.1 hypothetical protein ADICYQ_1611 [Cyclobacterium qasimii M12-11B]|tara:strand:- start:109537 stop:109683 length:147 start_codon:yes stop_codon:yes gene_type:complete